MSLRRERLNIEQSVVEQPLGSNSGVSNKDLAQTTDREMLDTDEVQTGIDEGHKMVPDTTLLSRLTNSLASMSQTKNEKDLLPVAAR